MVTTNLKILLQPSFWTFTNFVGQRIVAVPREGVDIERAV